MTYIVFQRQYADIEIKNRPFIAPSEGNDVEYADVKQGKGTCIAFLFAYLLLCLLDCWLVCDGWIDEL